MYATSFFVNKRFHYKIFWDWVVLSTPMAGNSSCADDLGRGGADTLCNYAALRGSSFIVHNTIHSFTARIHCRAGPYVSLSLRHQPLIRSFVSQLRSLAGFLPNVSVFPLTKTGMKSLDMILLRVGVKVIKNNLSLENYTPKGIKK